MREVRRFQQPLCIVKKKEQRRKCLFTRDSVEVDTLLRVCWRVCVCVKKESCCLSRCAQAYINGICTACVIMLK